MAQVRRWSKDDNRDLLHLIETGKIDPSDETNKTIEEVRLKYFSWCLYRNFAQNYRKKVREYKAEQLLKGGRHRGKKLFVCVYLHIYQ
jgi:hypothetical protein